MSERKLPIRAATLPWEDSVKMNVKEIGRRVLHLQHRTTYQPKRRDEKQ
jgi:hypothetical protein